MDAPASAAIGRGTLEELYAKYNRREMVHPDPLQFLYTYQDVRDREIVALVASSLAYGRVAQILKSVGRALDLMPVPALFLKRASWDELWGTFVDFKHRFTTGEALATLLFGAKRVIERHGSLGACFAAGLSDEHETILPALTTFVAQLREPIAGGRRAPLASPAGGSACKKLNLFLRWMVRRDDVDPGGWKAVPPAKLVVPLDTHMLRIGRALGFTRRKQADIRTAEEITAAFRKLSPEDPVRYDFALTRLGIRRDADLDEFLKRYGMPETT